jgi:restriction endonuclease
MDSGNSTLTWFCRLAFALWPVYEILQNLIIMPQEQFFALKHEMGFSRRKPARFASAQESTALDEADIELPGYLKQSMATTKSVHERVVYDSEGIERGFAEDLEKNEAVKLYAKLPGWFKVATPLGGYNPDWAVLIEKDSAQRLDLVVETKGSLFKDDLRSTEGGKIECGKAHFKALEVAENLAR